MIGNDMEDWNKSNFPNTAISLKIAKSFEDFKERKIELEEIRILFSDKLKKKFISENAKEPLANYFCGIITENGLFFPCSRMGHLSLAQDLIEGLELGHQNKRYGEYYMEHPWFILTNYCVLHGALMYSILWYNQIKDDKLDWITLQSIETLLKFIEKHEKFDVYGNSKDDLPKFFNNLFEIHTKLLKGEKLGKD